MFSRIKNAYKAWRRGERRIAPPGVTGRVYEKKNPKAEKSAADGIEISAGPTAVLDITITRADGSVEKRSIPASVEQRK